MEAATLERMMRTGIKDDYETPAEIFDPLHARFRFALDVAAQLTSARVPSYLGPDHVDPIRRDALIIPWGYDATGGVCWMNPPYSDGEMACRRTCKKKRCVTRGHHITVKVPGQHEFIAKAVLEASRGVPTIALLPARTDTRAFHQFIYDRLDQSWRREHGMRIAVRLLASRLTFRGETDPALFPSMLVAFWPRQRPFPGWPDLGRY